MQLIGRREKEDVRRVVLQRRLDVDRVFERSLVYLILSGR